MYFAKDKKKSVHVVECPLVLASILEVLFQDLLFFPPQYLCTFEMCTFSALPVCLKVLQTLLNKDQFLAGTLEYDS